ncbi:hypothetical protein [Leptothoe sp. PORK10 BA2]|uniref:hypothetical protein n=1 Tax=Leptothoe sp. PORK10 BA2 TaxID=3110254 RepID=UPI002B206572|nr:hypothetical protein [Leptothoe sp. PORK10 BA2]MEA5462376.1 hypothetical protein [Leptothoe sp. PORK10 BA2]
MSPASSVAATLRPETRQQIAIEALAKSKPISHLATDYEVSRKFVYEQSGKAKLALNESFAPTTPDEQILFHLPITKAWLCQLMLGLVLICHSSLRGVVELLRDVFDVAISASTVRNRLNTAAAQASAINGAQDLSPIEVDLRDEIFQCSNPVLVGVDAASTYCYLLALAEHRDADTWGCHLLDAVDQGLAPTRTIADAGSGLRAGHQAAFGDEIPCHGDVFHIQHQCQGVANSLTRQAMGATTRRQELEQKMVVAKQKAQGHCLSKKMTLARQHEVSAIALAQDVKTLIGWLNHDVLELAGPALAERQELYDFVVAELQFRETIGGKKVRVLRKALQNQRDDILGFAQVLDDKLADIAQQLKTPLPLVREMCLLFRKQPTSNAYWQAWNQLHQKLSGQFHQLYEAVQAAMKQTPRASSMVENLNSRLRNYFFLRKQLGPDYLNLLQFFLNSRQFMRSECEERVGKSPTELMTGKSHPHWLELLGFKRFQQA